MSLKYISAFLALSTVCAWAGPYAPKDLLGDDDQLLDCVKKGNLPELKRLIETEGRSPNSYFLSVIGETSILREAVDNNHSRIVEYLLSLESFDPNLRLKHDRDISYPLDDVMIYDSCSFVKALAKRADFDPNLPTFNYGKDTALAAAVGTGQSCIALALLNHPKTDPNRLEKGGSLPLVDAIRTGDRTVIKALLKHPAINPNAYTFGAYHVENLDGVTPLIAAVIQGDLETAKDLLRHPRLDRNMKDKVFGKTALDFANDFGDRRFIDLLK